MQKKTFQKANRSIDKRRFKTPTHHLGIESLRVQKRKFYVRHLHFGFLHDGTQYQRQAFGAFNGPK